MLAVLFLASNGFCDSMSDAYLSKYEQLTEGITTLGFQSSAEASNMKYKLKNEKNDLIIDMNKHYKGKIPADVQKKMKEIDDSWNQRAEKARAERKAETKARMEKFESDMKNRNPEEYERWKQRRQENLERALKKKQESELAQ